MSVLEGEREAGNKEYTRYAVKKNLQDFCNKSKFKYFFVRFKKI